MKKKNYKKNAITNQQKRISCRIIESVPNLETVIHNCQNNCKFSIGPLSENLFSLN